MIDNGFLRFDDVRVPRENMLAKNAKVSPRYIQHHMYPIPVGVNFLSMYFITDRICSLQESVNSGNIFSHICLSVSVHRAGGGGVPMMPLVSLRSHDQASNPLPTCHLGPPAHGTPSLHHMNLFEAVHLGPHPLRGELPTT